MRFSSQKGISLVEILIVIAIIALTWLIVYAGFSAINKRQALDKDGLLVTAIINEARSQTLSSKDATVYGVHLEEFSITLFKGSTYNESDPENKTSDLSAHSRISAFALSGGGDDIIFQRLTGATQNFGTITLELRSDSSASSTITVHKTGIIESD